MALKDELFYRDTSRAKSLLKQVEGAIAELGDPSDILEVSDQIESVVDPNSPQARAAKVKIVELRQRLLDLSNRNRLINFKHTGRGGKHLRIVGEWLPKLVETLDSPRPIELIPLPPLPDEPEDERKDEFKAALEEALITDKAYLKEVSKIDADNDDNAEFSLANAERALKDRLRKKLGWPSRKQLFDVSVQEQAQQLGIDPSFELDDPNPGRQRRRVNQWQTLLQEDELDRRLRALEGAAAESRSEYGIETLYLIVGFLEWFEKTPGGVADKPNLSPLLLVPVTIGKQDVARKSRSVDGRALLDDGEGAQKQNKDAYVLEAGADEITVNLCLRERLRQDFSIELPEWDEDVGVEVFLGQVKAVVEDNSNWKLRSFATVSKLTFNRLAMWVDLDPEKPGIEPPHVHPVLSELFGGGAPTENDSEELLTEDPEAGVPSLIMDCDSSQFAAIRQALRGRNLTIQGPPGTGKSQTIANLIGSFLHEGKTVLFVAEKMAALEVVHSRLNAAGIGDFLLELHSAKAAKKAVLASINRRLNRRRRSEGIINPNIVKRREALRDKLNAYASAINSTFGASGMTVHDIIWQWYEYHDKPAPERLAGFRITDISEWDKDVIEHRRECLLKLDDLTRRHWAEQKDGHHPWLWVRNPGLHVEQYDRLYRHVLDLIGKLEELETWIEVTQLISLPSSIQALDKLLGELEKLGSRPNEIASGIWKLARQNGAIRTVETVIAAYNGKNDAEAAISQLAPDAGQIPTAENEIDCLIDLMSELCAVIGQETDAVGLAESKTRNERVLSQLDATSRVIGQLRNVLQWDGTVSAEELEAAAVYIDLANEAPTTVISKRHLLGEEANPTIVRGKVAEFSACGQLTLEYNKVTKTPVDTLDYELVCKHRDELLNAGFFAILRPKYHSACSYCRAVLLDIDRKERAAFLVELSDHMATRKKLAEDPDLKTIAGDLFKGWGTNWTDLEGACSWAIGVRLRTPIINPYSSRIRKALFALGQDQAELARHLTKEGWPETFRSLADRCRREKIRLEEMRSSFHAEQGKITRFEEALARLGWRGEVSQERLKALKTALRRRGESIGILGENPGVLDLLLPNTSAAQACVKEISAAQLRVRSLPIQTTWRDRLLECGSQSVWTELADHSGALGLRLRSIQRVFGTLSEVAQIGTDVADRWHRCQLGEWIAVLREAAAEEGSLTTRAQLLAGEAKIKELKLDELFIAANGSAMQKFQGIGDLFRCMYLRSMVFKAIEDHPCLAEFRYASPSSVQEKFSKLDEELKQLHREILVERLMDRRPPEGNSTGLVATLTEMGLIRRVAPLERPRTSVRDLIRRAGRALQSLKPCFMMSPLSVAQLIERGKLIFDVVIFDEASQVRPEDAMSALARGRQFVVVGDRMQLPPTTFGEKSSQEEFLGDEETGEVEESAAVESILELASTSYGDGKTLLWHYRSRDPSLIAFSNREFYQNQLLLFPCPRAKSTATGVKYVWVGGRYSSSINVDEAKVCARAAVDFMRQSPDKSLGVVALNRPQADLIDLEVRHIMNDEPGAIAYKIRWESTLEPFFVKNLENVQGDERDVIFVSTVFGEDESGRFFQRFGPINSVVGHRRLNVLFTRAKFQLVIFTSMPTEKIVAGPESNWGVRALKEYLDYARTGLLERGTSTGRSADSPFEVAVRRSLESAGYQCEPQVGIAGFFVDLGVKHPMYPDHYMLGIECDGASYHGTPFARDRDRLRQSILESFGWKMYRIWSTDWFADPRTQLDKLCTRLEEIRTAPFDHGRQNHTDYQARYGKALRTNGSGAEQDGSETPKDNAGTYPG